MGRKNILSPPTPPPTSPPSFVMLCIVTTTHWGWDRRFVACHILPYSSTRCVRDMQIRNMDDQEAAVCCLPRVWNNATWGNSCHYIYIMHSNTWECVWLSTPVPAHLCWIWRYSCSLPMGSHGVCRLHASILHCSVMEGDHFWHFLEALWSSSSSW